MTRPAAYGFSALAVSAALGAPAAQARPDAAAVRLTVSAEEYDPAVASNAVLKCVVKNETPWGVHVPVGFDGGYVSVEAMGLRLRRAQHAAGDVALAWVGSGRERVVFELPLADLLAAPTADRKFGWSWDRRPSPPPSPIHQRFGPGWVEAATFVARLDVGVRFLESNPATLKVKGGGRKP
jgi:hypothetical protein